MSEVHGAVQEQPRYKLLSRAYFHDRLYEEEEEVSTYLRPGPHMQPVNEPAKVAFEKAKKTFIADPLGELMRAPAGGAELKPEHLAALNALAKMLGLIARGETETDAELGKRIGDALPVPPTVGGRRKAQGDGQGPDQP